MTTIDTTLSFNSAQRPDSSKAPLDSAFKKLLGNALPEFGSVGAREAIELLPIKPIDPAKGLGSITNPFTGAELNDRLAKDESAEVKLARAREAAQKLVSSTLVEPILKQVRESNKTPPPFGPSKSEKQFAVYLDAQLADQIVSSSQFPLVKRIEQDLLQHSAYMNEATKAAGERAPIDTDHPVDLLG